MKRFCISFFIVVIIILIGIVFLPTATNADYLRIHIRADSNLEKDQKVKYKVKESIVEYLTPFIANCNTKQKALETVQNNLQNVTFVANRVLKENGFNYTSNVKLTKEQFPTRVYDGITLEQGAYDALIIELGSGSGDNWWCVVYPPLCFVESNSSYVYKSKIIEIIDNFFAKIG